MARKKRILDDELTNKQRIQRMIERWDDNISFDEALYHMYVLKEIMEGIKSTERGKCVDQDELFDELERLCDEEEKSRLVAAGKSKPERDAQTHRGGRRAGNSQVVRSPLKKTRKHAS